MRMIALALIVLIAACGSKSAAPGSAHDVSAEGRAIRKAVSDVDAAQTEAGTALAAR